MEQRIFEVLKSVNEEILAYNGSDMIGDGIIDSFQVVDIVAGLEEEFSLEIGAEHVVAENFSNKDSVVALMKMLSGE